MMDPEIRKAWHEVEFKRIALWGNKSSNSLFLRFTIQRCQNQKQCPFRLCLDCEIAHVCPDLQLWTNYELASTVKHLPATWETWVRSLSREDPLEKEMATHSSTLAWKVPWMEEPGRLQLMGSERVGHDWATSLSSSLWSKYFSLYSAFWHWGCDSAD